MAAEKSAAAPHVGRGLVTLRLSTASISVTKFSLRAIVLKTLKISCERPKISCES